MATEAATPEAPAETPSRREAVDRVADKQPKDITGAEQSQATAWFLSDEPETGASAVLPINVAPAGQPEHYVDFTIGVVDRDRITAIRKSTERLNTATGTKEPDEMETNLQLVVEGLLDPNPRELAGQPVRGQRFSDPAEALRARFAHKPGLIDQLATRIVQISGYSDSDVKEIKAAGNS